MMRAWAGLGFAPLTSAQANRLHRLACDCGREFLGGEEYAPFVDHLLDVFEAQARR